MSPRLSFLAVGHVTNDVIGGRTVAGGSALYAALTARALGADARILTSAGPDWVGEADVPMTVRPAPRTTTFEHAYRGGARRSWIRAVAAALDEVVDADVVFLCPVAGEVGPRCFAGGRARVVGAGLQGWLRATAADGEVVRRPLPPLAGADAWFASNEDVDPPPDLPGVFVWTAGDAGAEVRVDGRWHHVRACPTTAVDPTGAGDVFAAAFLVAWARGEPPLRAAAIGACAASIAVEGPGVTAVKNLHGLAERLRTY
ncbi:MAG TPA: PfkB family carbohydrate kinase [Haliangiales bacterium]|nr:PfkB family carbohydrate kinase [Haliangiales bacterium]